MSRLQSSHAPLLTDNILTTCAVCAVRVLCAVRVCVR